MPQSKLNPALLKLTLPVASYEALRERAANDDIPVSEAARRALWLYTWVRGRQDEGAELVVTQKGRKDERIILAGMRWETRGKGGS